MYDVNWLAGWLLMCGFDDQNTWNTIPVSEQKITLNNWVIKHWIVEQKQIKQNRTELNEQETNNQINWYGYNLTDELNINKPVGWMVTVLYLWGLNILWLWNWQLQPCLPRCLLWSTRCHVVSFFAFSAESLVASWKTIEPPTAFLLHTNRPGAVSVKFHN